MNFLRDTDAAAASLVALRAEIAAKRAQVNALKRSPLPVDERVQRARVALKAAVGKREFEREIAHLGMPGPFALRAIDAPMIGWLLRDLLEQALLERLAALYAETELESGGDAAAQLAQLVEDLAALERAEEHEVLKLKQAGHQVLHRADVDPAILLEVWGEAS